MWSTSDPVPARQSRLFVRRAHFGRIDEVKRILRPTCFGTVTDLRAAYRDRPDPGLPRDPFPPRSTIYNIFRKFQGDGVWDEIWAQLHMGLIEYLGREATPTAA